MARKGHKFLCVVLFVALILTTALVGAFSAFAVTDEEAETVGASGDVVYVKVNNGWSNLHCYMWTDGQGNNAQWPGAAMQAVSDGVYAYTVTGNFSKIIFNNGNSGNGNQTSDMSYPGGGKIYDLSAGSWSDYGDAPTPTQGQTTPPVPGGEVIVYFKNTANWSAPRCYMWTDNQGNNGTWPGVAMTNLGDGIWMYQTNQSFAKVIFNNGSSGSGNQTDDLALQNGKVFDFAAGKWEEFDTSALKITAFNADPSSDIYPNTDISLTASAQGSGEVYYKYSVKNAAGSASVIADYSTVSSAVWTPTAAGTYTLTLDVKDADGNENSRSMSITVENDAQLKKPVIKSVYPANLNLVKRNANTTISVSAGGGQTGTNLLFYKYIISDPNGVENTPYYTLNSRLEYVFTKLGTYNVEVFVQASDNTTVSRTYTYTVTDDLPDPTVRPTTPVATTTPIVTQAPTQKPTQAPTQAPTTVRPTNPPTPTVSPTTTPSGYQVGDANKDHYVDIKDATYVQMYCAEYPEAKTIDKTLADVNGDGKVTVVDATAIQYLIAS
ncbi:MAG: starch-binding protein [Ruminococcus sp.]